MAGLDYNISASEQGLSIAISGYSDKQEILLHKLIHAVAKPLLYRQHWSCPFNCVVLRAVDFEFWNWVIVDCDIKTGLAKNIESYIFGGKLKNTL